MRIEFRKDIRNQYLVIDPGASGQEGDYRLNMLISNKIEMFAPCSSELVNGSELFYYDITGLTPLSTYLNTCQADQKFFSALFLSLANALERLQEFLLDPDGMLLDPQYIFKHGGSEEMTFVYYPHSEKGFAENCKSLSENLLGRIGHEDIEAVRYGYGFYKNCVAGNITNDSLRDMAGGAIEDMPQRGSISSRNIYKAKMEMKNTDRGADMLAERGWYKEEEVNNDYGFLYPEKEKPKRQRKNSGFLGKILKVREKARKYGNIKNKTADRFEQKTSIDAKRRKEENSDYGRDFEEEIEKQDYIDEPDDNYGWDAPVVKDESGETALLEPRPKETAKAWLMPGNGFPKDGIMLVKERYLVGKKASGADIVLDSKTVSRAHAALTWQQGGYILVDLSSKNGTKVNGVKIECGEKVSLRDGDSIIFSDAGCIYKQTFFKP